MGHHHAHQGHGHNHATGNILTAFWLNTAFAVLELAGGFYTNSVAIMSDAFHDFGDSLSLGLTYYFQKKSEKGRDAVYTYGYKRFSLLGAFITSVVLAVGSVFIITEAVKRFINPEQADAKGMIVLAFIGIAVNGAAMLRLRKGSTLSERAVSLHFLEDVLGWIAVLVGAVVMLFFDVPILDPILSLGIALFILFNVYKNLKSVLKIVLQAVPENLSEAELKNMLEEFREVDEIHDVRSWSMDGLYNVVTFHAVVAEDKTPIELEQLKHQLKATLKSNGIGHVTIEFESRKCAVEEE